MDLDELRRLAGITETQMSPIGSNISLSNTERRALEKKYKVKPGDELWFIINFSRPYLTGPVEDQIQKYLKKHKKD